MTPGAAAERSAQIVGHLTATVVRGNVKGVMLYLPFDPSAKGGAAVEPDLRPLIAVAIAAGKRVIAPRVNWGEGTLLPVELTSAQYQQEVRRWGVPEPIGPEADLKGIDLVLTPGAAFDLSGGRLGRGAGYYDKLFASLLRENVAHTRIGVCFEEQIVERVPMEEHDAVMDGLVTESGLRRTRF